MTAKLDELEKLARAAAFGPWEHIHISPSVESIVRYEGEGKHYQVGTFSGAESDAKHIAAANPDTVLKLIAVVRAAERLKRLKGHGESLAEFDEALQALNDRNPVTVLT